MKKLWAVAVSVAVIVGVMGTAAAEPLTNNDDELGFLSGFWSDWGLTVRSAGCSSLADRRVCSYDVKNTDGLTVVFGSDGSDLPVTNVMVTMEPQDDPFFFLVTSANAMKALDGAWSKAEREALIKQLYKGAGSSPATAEHENISITLTRLGRAAAFEAKLD